MKIKSANAEPRCIRLNRNNATGFSLIELLVCIGILVILLAITIPAVQSTRESSRQVACRSTMRQVGIASANFATTKGTIPSSGLSSLNGHRETYFDWSFLTQIASYLDVGKSHEEPIYYGTVGIGTRSDWNSLADFYQCPSGFGKEALVGCANEFGGEEIVGLVLFTVDYAGNGGFIKRVPGKYELSPGGIDVVISENPLHTRLSSVSDGLANTVQVWESSSGKLVAPQTAPSNVNQAMPDSFQMLFNSGSIVAKSEGRARSRTYLYSVSGIRVGAIEALHPTHVGLDRTINVSNLNCGPFSRHPDGVHMLFLDGSVKLFTESTDRTLFISICTRNRGD